MLRRRPLVAFAGVVIAVVGVAGCGGDGGPSRREFVAAADRICEQVQTRLHDLEQPDPADASEVEIFTRDMAPLARRELEQLRDLELPEDQPERFSQDVESFFAVFARMIRVLDRARQQSEDPDAVQAAFAELAEGNDDLRVYADRIGFRACGREFRELGDVTGVHVPLNDLRIGDCFNELEGGSDEVSVVACAENHTGEVFAKTEMEAAPDAQFPGADEVKSFADQYCSSQFAGYVGTSFRESTLSGFFFRPSEGTWPDGDRTVVCFLTMKDESPRVGSARGAKV